MPRVGNEFLTSETSSLDAAFAAPHADVSIEKPREIPWPVLTKLSPGNLKMTASALMNEWEKTMTHSATIDLTAATYPSKAQKAD